MTRTVLSDHFSGLNSKLQNVSAERFWIIDIEWNSNNSIFSCSDFQFTGIIVLPKCVI